MKRPEFEKLLADKHKLVHAIREKAHRVHHLVNQHYDGNLPYGHHLDMVVEQVEEFGHEAVETEAEFEAMIFGAYFHDAIEDARLTYNDLKAVAQMMLKPEAVMPAIEIAYALTNEKGRTRAERAGAAYYAGIRSTPFAPLVKFADRLANALYSVSHSGKELPGRMHHIYAKELPHFLASVVDNASSDMRLRVPQPMIDRLIAILSK